MTATLSPTTRHLTRAKIKAKAWMPYLSHVLSSMRTFIEPRVPTMCVDEHARLYVNESWIQTLSVDQLAYVLLHEVLHVVLSHAKRRKATLPDADRQQCKVWNIAADLCIQQMLARNHEHHEPKDGVKIGGCIPDTNVPFLSVPGLSRGMATEKYYGVLWDFLNKCVDGPTPPPKGGDGPTGLPTHATSKPDDGEQDGEGENEGGDGSTECEDECGSSSDGVKRDYERPTRLAEQAMVEAKLAEVEKRIEEQEARAPGSVPGQLRQSLEARLRPQPDPFDQLRGLVARSVASPVGADEHTYRRLNRRQPNNIARLRGVVKFAPECSVIVDTSGSMSCGNIRDKAMTAVAQGLRKVQRPRVVCFDTQVQDAKRLSSMKDFEWVGNGGTDMAAACEQEDREHRPDAIVLITDGETEWPSKPTRARLIVALCKEPGWGGPIPSWAKVVKCYEEGPRYAG